MWSDCHASKPTWFDWNFASNVKLVLHDSKNHASQCRGNLPAESTTSQFWSATDMYGIFSQDEFSTFLYYRAIQYNTEQRQAIVYTEQHIRLTCKRMSSPQCKYCVYCLSISTTVVRNTAAQVLRYSAKITS